MPRVTRHHPTFETDEHFADCIGLIYADPDSPGIRRTAWGSGFTFRNPDGSVVRGRERERCEALVLPPAWTDVWVCPEAAGHLQALGTDDAGRRQYRYHETWTEARAAANFDRLHGVGTKLADVRRAVQEDLESGDPERRALATMIGLMDASLERVGNAESVSQFGTRGISTLSPENVDVSRRTVRLAFRGKGGVDHDVTIEDHHLADAVAELVGRAEQWLFEVGDTVLAAADANAYLDDHSAGYLDCKDIRTWGGSAAALAARASGIEQEPKIADAAAEVLHNTRSVARGSYIHPSVFEAERSEIDDAWGRSRRSRWYGRGERALLYLLEATPALFDRYHVRSPAAA